MPDLECHLFSPQYYLQTFNNCGEEDGSEPKFTVLRSHAILKLPQSTISILYHYTLHVPIIASSHDAFATSKMLTLGCISDKLNQNIVHQFASEADRTGSDHRDFKGHD